MGRDRPEFVDIYALRREAAPLSWMDRNATRRQIIKVGGLAALGFVFSKPIIDTIRPTPIFAQYGPPIDENDEPPPLTPVLPPHSPKIYWSRCTVDPGGIFRANLDGSLVQPVITTVSLDACVWGIAFDKGAGKMYWTEPNADRIMRADLDATNREILIALPAASSLRGIALDTVGGKMYWCDTGTEEIKRANLDGAEIEDLVGANSPNHIALDVDGGKMYWTDIGSRRILRANLNGSAVEALYSTGNPFVRPQSIDLDIPSGKMYWTNRGVGENIVRRANFDGTGIEVLVPNQGTLLGIALDLSSGKMYLFDNDEHKIKRANLDGTELETLVTGVSAGSSITVLL